MRLFIIILSTVIFLIVTINLFVTLVIFLAQDYHVLDYVNIYQVFQLPRYRQVRSKILKNNYTILIGDDQTGVKNFIEHQANIQTVEGRPVVIKRYQSTHKQKQTWLKTIKQTRFYMQVALGMSRQQRTQIFFIKSMEQFPFEEIQFIKEKYPSDNIIVVSEVNFTNKIKPFKKIVFPPVDLQELKHLSAEYYMLKPKQIEKILSENDRSVEKVFKYFKRRSKFESETLEEVVEVDDIEDLNEISHQLAEKQAKKIERKRKIAQQKKENSNRKQKQSKQRKISK